MAEKIFPFARQMAEFDEEDLRPFSSTSRPRTSAAQRMVAAEGEPGPGPGVAGPRPATGLRPKTGYRQQSSSRIGTAVGSRVDAVWRVRSLTRVMLY